VLAKCLVGFERGDAAVLGDVRDMRVITGL
jgi:hypothetical protein